jgi:hypothetical protein
MKMFDPKRARETAQRLRDGLPACPLIERETVKMPGDLIIFPHRTERA